MKEIAKVEAGNDLFQIKVYSGRGGFVNSSPSVPIRLYKFDGDEWNRVENMDLQRDNASSRKSDTLALQEAIAKIPHYTENKIDRIMIDESFSEEATLQTYGGDGTFVNRKLFSDIRAGEEISVDDDVYLAPVIPVSEGLKMRLFKVGNEQATRLTEPNIPPKVDAIVYGERIEEPEDKASEVNYF